MMPGAVAQGGTVWFNSAPCRFIIVFFEWWLMNPFEWLAEHWTHDPKGVGAPNGTWLKKGVHGPAQKIEVFPPGHLKPDDADQVMNARGFQPGLYSGESYRDYVEAQGSRRDPIVVYFEMRSNYPKNCVRLDELCQKWVKWTQVIPPSPP